jgi:hypothetical protein
MPGARRPREWCQYLRSRLLWISQAGTQASRRMSRLAATLHQCLGDLLRPLKGGQVTAVRHHYQACTLDPAGDFGRSVGRDQLIAVADQDQRRAADAGKSRPRVGAAHERLLRADERLGPDVVGHQAHQPSQDHVVLAVAVDQDGEEQVEYLGGASAAGQRDLGLAPLGLFGVSGRAVVSSNASLATRSGAWRRMRRV